MILDEPTNHLDIRYQLEILQCVKKLNIGVLAALHDLETAATILRLSLCDEGRQNLYVWNTGRGINTRNDQ